ncbi:efflux transporter outer membrane subunit [Klebsiella oxytoca]|uniref:efflux transporter outer membrane subunit n=1 Tax=Klebsiella oxytoca TaxID=571 RepID=UPI00157B1C8E|nr:efflux transporter outer membrane subunit [Klebsiella oxytoca]
MKMSLSITSTLCLLVLSGCTVGPDYQRPAMAVPLHYKEARHWQQATPHDDLSKGTWWAVYHDPELDRLLRQVSISNQNVANYAALYRQANALVSGSQADLLPTIGYDASTTRSSSHSSGARTTSNTHQAELSASWELDLWGKLRRTVEENRASAEASAAELNNVTLSAQSELAQDYFQLRIMDEKIALSQRSIAAYERYLTVINHKYQAGSESRATQAQAQMQLESARASMQDYQWQRAQLEHAIALLLGLAPAQFSLPVAKLNATLPAIPSAMPAHLLQRRPDIAEAERNVAAANAAVGVAIAGYYPDLTLSASGGVSASSLQNLLSLPNRVWSLGPSLSGTLLDFGATSSEVEQARAAYDAKVASYRQTVLEGLQEVEDYLVELNTLQGEVASQQRATAAAQISASVTRNQYDAGMIDYLDVATTENSSLTEQQSLLSLQSTQWTASVKLIAALGGSWE